MLQRAIRFLIADLLLAASAFAGVNISSPASGSTSESPVHFVASASSSAPITAMRIYVDNVSMFLTSSNNLNTSMPLSAGSHNVIVQAWDSTGAVFKTPVTINVTVPSGAVAVSSPGSGATVSSPFQLAASASAPHPIAAMVAYLDGQEVAKVEGSSMSSNVSSGTGTHSLVVQAWDNTGTIYKQSQTLTVSSGLPANAVTKSSIQKLGGWQSCTVCAGQGGNGPEGSTSFVQFQSSPSVSGSSSKISISSGTPYTDALWVNQLGAANSASNFVYDVDFYLTDPQAAQALEFDVNQSIGNLKFIFGTQCNIKNVGVWDVWDTAGNTWRSTGVPCAMPSAFTWHHLTWQLHRTSTQVTFVALTLDGVTHFVNQTYNAKPVSANELNVAIQLDMDSAAQPFSEWVDNITLSYW